MKPTHRQTNHWRKMWRTHPERMRSNLEAINVLQDQKVEQRRAALRAVLKLVPDQPYIPSSMRDHLAEAWESVFGENLGSDKAWLHIRFCLRQGIIVRRPDGLYAKVVDKGGQSGTIAS